MFTSLRRLMFTLLLAAASHLGVATVASAHYLNLSATSVCDPTTGGALIQFVATSWSTGTQGSNPDIDIQFNGVGVATGAFGPTLFSFSGSLPAPAGSASVSVTALAAEAWGDGYPWGASTSTTVVIPTDCAQQGLGRFTGGGNQVRVDNVRVTRGLTIHCDLLLSNNLEVNWQGNSFHMTEHLTTVACTDSPSIIQAPPAAPIDTLIGVGTGRYNNVDGFTIHFTLVDAGEPGSSDMMRIYIFETLKPSNVVLNVPLQLLTGGNLQAHFDQPHK